jgi:hypothetical protein
MAVLQTMATLAEPIVQGRRSGERCLSRSLDGEVGLLVTWPTGGNAASRRNLVRSNGIRTPGLIASLITESISREAAAGRQAAS